VMCLDCLIVGSLPKYNLRLLPSASALDVSEWQPLLLCWLCCASGSWSLACPKEAWVGSQARPCEIHCGHSATVTGLSPCTWCPPVSVVTPVLHNYLHLNSVLIRWLSRQILGTFEQCSALCDITEHGTVKYFHSVSGLCVVCEVCALVMKQFL
jgi:hypothetical protein